MYTNNAYLNNSTIDRKDKSKPLVITMCGTYKLYTRPKLPTWRPRGRLDFQLLYIAAGKAHFHFDNNDEATIVHAGHMVLYRPKEPQKYEYYAKDQTEVYWVHFTGNNVTNLLRSYGLTNKKVFHCGSGAEYQNLFCSMIKELQMCQDGYEEMLEIYLRQIFIRLQRHFKSSLNSDNSHAFEEIDNAISYFCEHYNEPINIDDYAKENCSCSKFLSQILKIVVKNFSEIVPGKQAQKEGFRPLIFLTHSMRITLLIIIEFDPCIYAVKFNFIPFHVPLYQAADVIQNRT